VRHFLGKIYVGDVSCVCIIRTYNTYKWVLKMLIKPEIKERIVAAANALAAEGSDSPTNDQVRDRMGGGSLSHISPVMRDWRESRKTEVGVALEIPADLKKAIETSVAQVWLTASKLASSTVDTVKQEAEAAVEAATSERDEALEEIIRLEERIADLLNVLTEKDQSIKSVQDKLDEEFARSARVTSDNAALTTRMEDRDEQIKSLKAELKLVEIARKSKG
jgi:Plasmid replication region DNA-binding N-term